MPPHRLFRKHVSGDRGQIIYRNKNERWCPRNGAFMPCPEDEAHDEARAANRRAGNNMLAIMFVGAIVLVCRDSFTDFARLIWSFL